MDKVKKDPKDERTRDPKKFSQTVYTMVHKPHNGFANFAVATLIIVDGVIREIKLSDPYAGFEAAAHLEIRNSKLLEHLRRTYPSGEFQYAI